VRPKIATLEEYPLLFCFEHRELPAKLLDYFLRRNDSNINQSLEECPLLLCRYTGLFCGYVSSTALTNKICRRAPDEFPQGGKKLRITVPIFISTFDPTTWLYSHHRVAIWITFTQRSLDFRFKSGNTLSGTNNMYTKITWLSNWVCQSHCGKFRKLIYNFWLSTMFT